jgi:hypothetical protein
MKIFAFACCAGVLLLHPGCGEDACPELSDAFRSSGVEQGLVVIYTQKAADGCRLRSGEDLLLAKLSAPMPTSGTAAQAAMFYDAESIEVIQTEADGLTRELDLGNYVVCEFDLYDETDYPGFVTATFHGVAFTLESGDVVGAAFHTAEGYEQRGGRLVGFCGTHRDDHENCLKVDDPTPWIE